MAGRVAVERTHICDVVGCKDAWQILRNRSCLSRGTAVNLCGVLQTRSEMIDIKGTKLFLIKLECGINIIVKKSTCLRWHDEIQIGHEHVYTKLIPTSLQKGGNHQHELYAVDEGSKMYIRHDVDFAIISAEEWLQKHSKPSFRNTEFKNIPAPIENLDLFSYKGTVTQVLDVSFRIYELDNAVRLFMSQCPPAAPRPRVGDELLIHNAHHQLNTKHAKLLLHCCALSSIQISSKRERLEDSTDVPSITLQKTLYASLLSQSQVENLCEIKLMLNQQFPQPRLSDRMFLHLMKTEPSIGSMFISNSRNVLDEFLTCLHHCPLTRRETLPEFGFVCIKDLLQVPWDSDFIPSSMKPPTSDWHHGVKRFGSQCLLGLLKTSEETGQLLLCDATGALDVVTCCIHSNPTASLSMATSTECVHNTQTVNIDMDTGIETESIDGGDSDDSGLDRAVLKHSCFDGCCCSSRTYGQTFPCCYAHQCCQGKVVCVRNFYLVTEPRTNKTLIKKCMPSTSALEYSSSYRYLVLDLLKTGMVCDFGKEKCSTVKRSCSSAELMSNENNVGCSDIKYKPSDIANDQKFNSSVCQFAATNTLNTCSGGQGQGVLHKHERAGGGFVFCRQLSCSGRPPSHTNDAGLTDTVKPAKADCTKQHAKDVVSKPDEIDTEAFEKEHEKGSSDLMEPADKVCLLFEGPLLRHYGVIYPGMFLNFVAAKSAPLFAMNISNVKIQKMAVKSKTRILLSVNSAADVCETWQGTWSPWDTLSSLTAVLQQGFQIGIVNFEGLVVRRMTTSPDRESSHKDTWSSAGVPQQCARLLVEDILHENKKIWLYVNERDARCPAGLIPGSRAAFYNVERKVAKNGNVYCRYVQFSSVRILCFQSDRLAFSSRDNVKNDIPAQASALPLVFLSDIWTQSCTSQVYTSQVYRCACDVIRVPKVSLKCTCGTCTSLIVGGQCTSPGCITGETWDYSARASIVVDDGSCVAMVTLTGPDVQSLLQLTDEQWNALRQEVSMVGEVFVQGVCPVLETPVHQFVHMLSESRSVKRTWDLLLAPSVTRIDINTIEPEDFVWKEFDTGSGRVNTQCLPFLQLKCLKLSTFCPESIIQHQM
ncbi:CST complex subunit CTC1-like isoform X2 [Dreissena polymorpha]|uniref:CST complex subunit CTC1-like isoform X2 n=1 Tax=Dreissena polymorpha TaxID=45954 RepID=UPI002264E276|nr:CST complex subunit CTC1-like isoform X2 [Dreissena polymorpha]